MLLLFHSVVCCCYHVYGELKIIKTVPVILIAAQVTAGVRLPVHIKQQQIVES